MRIFITGGRGYLAGHLVEQLKVLNVDIVVASRAPQTLNTRSEQIRSVHIDYTNIEELGRQLSDVDIVIHAAGLDSRSCELNPEMARKVNTTYTQNLLAAAKESAVKSFNYISTAHVYRAPLIGLIDENTSVSNSHPYASSHASADFSVAQAMKTFEFGSLSIRLSNSYGMPISDSQNAMHLAINSFCKQAIYSNEILIDGDVNSQRNFIPVQSAVAEILKLSLRDQNRIKSPVMNLGSLKSFSVGEVAGLIAHRMQVLFGRKIMIRAIQKHKQVSPAMTLDYRSIFREFTDHNHSYYLDVMLMALSRRARSGD